MGGRRTQGVSPRAKTRCGELVWWQDGLHVEPESQDERAALAVPYRGLDLVDVGHDVPTGPASFHLGDKKAVVGVNEGSEMIP